jgi:DNA-binding beta-propeller fold protein YncE
VWVTVQGEDALVALNPKDGSVSARVPLAYGSGPHGIVFTPDGLAGLVTLESRSSLISIDPASGAQRALLNLPGDVRGIAVAADSAEALVTRFRSRMDRAEVHRVSLGAGGKALSLRQTIALQVDTTTVDGENRARGVPNYLHQVVLSPDGRRAALPSKKDNIAGGLFRDGRPLEHDTTVRSIVSQLDLASGSERFAEQLDFNDRAPARAAAWSPAGDYLFVAQMEGNRVAIVDAHNRSVRGEIETDRAPHGLYVDEKRQRLYVNNFLGRSVAAYDIAQVLSADSFAARPLGTVATVAVEPLPEPVLRGKRVFYNAADPRMSRNNYMACASCHADGGDDGMVWDFTQRGEGLRRTINLLGRQGLGHGRAHWSANFDEPQDFENDIRGAFGGAGFLGDEDFEAARDPLGAPKAGRSRELDDLAAYLGSLSRHPRSPAREPDGRLSATAVRGQQVFQAMQCARCHTGPTQRDGLRHDVGTLQRSSGKGRHRPLAGVGVSTPPLHGLWAAPSYFHNGQAATLHDVFAAGHGGTQSLPAADRDALVELLRSIDARGGPVDTPPRP